MRLKAASFSALALGCAAQDTQETDQDIDTPEVEPTVMDQAQDLPAEENDILPGAGEL